MPCVVADTSPLFYLARLRRFSLLESLYGSVHVPETVWQETLAGGRLDSEIPPMLTAARASGWLTVHPVPPPLPLSGAALLDAGERDALALARQLDATLLLIDDRRGVRVATGLGFNVTGTLGVLVEARQAGLISRLAPELRSLRERTSFHFTEALFVHVLSLVRETDDASS